MFPSLASVCPVTNTFLNKAMEMATCFPFDRDCPGGGALVPCSQRCAGLHHLWLSYNRARTNVITVICQAKYIGENCHSFWLTLSLHPTKLALHLYGIQESFFIVLAMILTDTDPFSKIQA